MRGIAPCTSADLKSFGVQRNAAAMHSPRSYLRYKITDSTLEIDSPGASLLRSHAANETRLCPRFLAARWTAVACLRIGPCLHSIRTGRDFLINFDDLALTSTILRASSVAFIVNTLTEFLCFFSLKLEDMQL